MKDPDAPIAAELRAAAAQPVDELLLRQATNVLASIREIQAAGLPRHTRAYYRTLRQLFRETARALGVDRAQVEKLLKGVTSLIAAALAALEATQADLGLVSAAFS